MAELNDLISKPIKQMTTDELEQCIMLMKKMKINKDKIPKTNKDKQLNNLLDNFTPEQISTIMSKLKETKI